MHSQDSWVMACKFVSTQRKELWRTTDKSKVGGTGGTPPRPWARKWGPNICLTVIGCLSCKANILSSFVYLSCYTKANISLDKLENHNVQVKQTKMTYSKHTNHTQD